MLNWLNSPDRRSPSLGPLRVGILLVPPFALLPYASAVEPLRAANDLASKQLFEWVHIAPKDRTARASSGLAIATEYGVEDAVQLDFLLVCAGTGVERFHDRSTFSFVRKVARSGIPICGISDGTHVLARAGVLAGYRVTMHWDHVAGFREEFPDMDVTTNVFEIDRNRVTCSGGITPIDMMHELIKRLYGARLATEVSDWFQHASVRAGDEPPRMTIRDRTGAVDDRVVAAIARLEASVEERISLAAVAAESGLSLRQLERLFVSNVGLPMASYYRKVRLIRARELLGQTSMPVTEVALATGFSSASHFSRVYKRLFGQAPAIERRDKNLNGMTSRGDMPTHRPIDV